MISVILRAVDQLILTLIDLTGGGVWAAAFLMTCFVIGLAVWTMFILEVFDHGVQYLLKFCNWLLDKIIFLLNI